MLSYHYYIQLSKRQEQEQPQRLTDTERYTLIHYAYNWHVRGTHTIPSIVKIMGLNSIWLFSFRNCPMYVWHDQSYTSSWTLSLESGHNILQFELATTSYEYLPSGTSGKVLGYIYLEELVPNSHDCTMYHSSIRVGVMNGRKSQCWRYLEQIRQLWKRNFSQILRRLEKSDRRRE